ncbi:archaeal proteasome endopeptidase complex subunit alpha [Candidatus Micrarchaeota archaeon]|nr:archaeal proteasome endopeptidase complex subunit alpha [Candidatus Micrarchaeota archaeon]MBD3417561.1 archaeal proteasome endopeptidase complex subunit alpha [Candidatus Micrarchaeota archaeon]
MYGVTPQAYDRTITVFSPDGRLFQVEYAKEAVKRGATAIGVSGEDGVALIAYKSAHSKLIVSESLRKVFEIDDHISATASGLIADARKLIEVARMNAQRHRMTYNESASPESIARGVCDVMQLYTQYGGIRPFGVSLLIAGIGPNGPELFEAEPSGAMTGYFADSVGNAKKEVDEYLEAKYSPEVELQEGIGVAVDALKKFSETKIVPANLEITYAYKKDKKFKLMEEKDILKLLKPAK